MALYLIGLGLNERGISIHGKSIIRNCKEIYLENYTVDFPYTKTKLEKQLKVKIKDADRNLVESDELIEMAKTREVCLLVYGSPLSATTHITLINDCKKQKVKYKILYAGSVFDAAAESGLQLYKFGKTASLPKYQKNFEPQSFINVIKNNQKIGAHTLLLVDIGLEFVEAKEQLKKCEFDFGKVVVCLQLGVKSKFFHDNLEKIDETKILKPYCIIIPGKLSGDEEENLKNIQKLLK